MKEIDTAEYTYVIGSSSAVGVAVMKSFNTGISKLVCAYSIKERRSFLDILPIFHTSVFHSEVKCRFRMHYRIDL